MSIEIARGFVAIIGAFIGSFFSKIAESLMKAFSGAFTKEEMTVKAVIAFLASVGFLIYALVTMTAAWWMLAIIPVGVVGGAIVLTATHFLVDVIVSSATNLWSVTKSFFTSAKATAEATN